MNALLQEKSFDIEFNKFDDSIKNANDIFMIQFMESVCTKEPNVFIESSWEDFKKSAMEAINKILEKLKEFFKELRRMITTKIEQIRLNEKLDELKDVMAKKRAKALGQKYSYFDIKKYKEYYSQFINRYTAELKKGLNQEFKSVEEYEKWKEKMLNHLSDFNYKLSDEEQWKLSIAINSAVSLSEEEVKNREKNLKMVEEDGTMAIKGLESYYKKIDVERSYVNFNDHKLKIFSLQNSFIGLVVRQLSKAIQTVANFIAKHTLLCVTGLLVLLIAL